MSWRLWAVLAVLAVLACGGDNKVVGGSGTVSGSVAGNSWTHIAAAYWIGKPAAGSPPVILFLLEAPLDCPTISLLNWDKTIGVSQVLEIGLSEAAARTFHVPGDGVVAYLRDTLNPDADSATITATAINPMRNLTGTFDAMFRTDRLQGTFDAAYCPRGVEP